MMIIQMNEMNGKMIGRKPLYIALAQRKEERRSHLQVLLIPLTELYDLYSDNDSHISHLCFLVSDSIFPYETKWDNVANGITNAWFPPPPTRRCNGRSTPSNVRRTERSRSGAVSAYGVRLPTSVHAWCASGCWPG